MSIFSRASFTANLCLGLFRVTKCSTRSHKVFTAVEDILKMDSFEERRKLAQAKVSKCGKDKFIKQIVKDLEPESTCDARNLKELVFLAEPNDIDLVLASLQKLELQSKALRLSDFHLDGALMRMFYYLNEADLACAFFMDPSLKTLHIGHTAVLILMQLLFNNEKYSHILECFDVLEEKQLTNIWSSSILALFHVVACLKLNTLEAHKKAVVCFEKVKDYRKPSTVRCLATAYCALNVDPERVYSILDFARGDTERFKSIPSIDKLRFNILMQLHLKAGKLLHVLKQVEACKQVLTCDTVDLLLASLDSGSISDMKSFISENVKVDKQTLRNHLINLCILCNN